MLNRTDIVLRYQEPFVRWINEADPYTEDPDITVGPDEQTVYLIHQIENRDELDEWIALNYEALFETELEEWQFPIACPNPIQRKSEASRQPRS